MKWRPGAAVCVVMASAGYPGTVGKGIPIHGLEVVGRMPEVKVFHAGTACDQEHVVTHGGRVLGVTAWAETLRQARDKAYRAVEQISFQGAHYRRDIAAQALA